MAHAASFRDPEREATSRSRKPSPIVYVLTDSPERSDHLRETLAAPELAVHVYAEGDRFLAEVDPEHAVCAIVDADLPGSVSGIDVIARLHARAPEVVALATTPAGDVRTAVEAFRAGAADLFERPLSLAQVRRRVDRARQAAAGTGP